MIHNPIKYAKFLWRILYRYAFQCSGRLLIFLFIFISGFYVNRRFFSLYKKPLIITAWENVHNDHSSCNLRILDGHSSKFNEPRCYPLLINFADGCCQKEQQNNCLTGLKHGVRQCAMYDKTIFDSYPDFKNRNRNILERKRGAGYWLWKPFILFQELYLARDGDIIIYSDSLVDFVANISYLTKLTEKQDIIVFQLAGMKESMWTKRDAFVLLNVDQLEYANTSASLTSYFLIRKSSTSMAFVSEWLTYAQDSRAITDDENVFHSPNYADFRAHRHDQSLVSLLVKKWKFMTYPDPSQWGEGEHRPYPTVFNHHRTKSSFSFLY